MAGEKLTQQTGKTSGFADDDLMHVVDVSFNPPGTSFKVKLLNLWKFFVTKISGRDTSVDNTTGVLTINDYTSLQLEQSQPESPTIALSSDASPNHCVIIERDGGAALTGLTVTSYSNPKDGAIAHVKVSSRIQGAFVILGTWVGGSGSDIEPSIFYSRYDQTGSAWIPIVRIPLTMLELSLQAAYNGGNTINTSTLSIDATTNLIALTIASDLSIVGDYVVALGYGAANNNTGTDVVANGNLAAHGNTGDYVVANGSSAASGNTGSDVVALGLDAAVNNTGDYVVANGNLAAHGNTGDFVVALGSSAANQNTGIAVVALGESAAYENTGDYVVALGESAALGNSGSDVVANGHGAAGSNTGSDVVANGNGAASGNTGSDVVALGRGAAQGNTKSNIFTISPYSIPTFADKAAADAEITAGNGYVPGLYIYWNTDTSDVGGVLIPV